MRKKQQNNEITPSIENRLAHKERISKVNRQLLGCQSVGVTAAVKLLNAAFTIEIRSFVDFIVAYNFAEYECLKQIEPCSRP